MSLAQIFAPLPVSEVASTFTAKRHFYIPGARDKFIDLFSLARLERCLRVPPEANHPADRGMYVRASFDRGQTKYRIPPQFALRLNKAGAGICVDHMELGDPLLAAVIERARRDLLFIGKADFRAYLSPDGHGFDTHFDMRIATTLQIEGRKRWLYSNEVALDWPHYQVASEAEARDRIARHHAELEEYRPPEECTFNEVILEPGDVLSIPAGTWHSARAIGHSLALNFAFELRSSWEIMSALILSELKKDNRWREPAFCINSADPALLPSALTGHFESRIDMLIDSLNQMKKDRSHIYAQWRKQCDIAGWTGVKQPLEPSVAKPKVLLRYLNKAADLCDYWKVALHAFQHRELARTSPAVTGMGRVADRLS